METGANTGASLQASAAPAGTFTRDLLGRELLRGWWLIATLSHGGHWPSVEEGPWSCLLFPAWGCLGPGADIRKPRPEGASLVMQRGQQAGGGIDPYKVEY